MKYTNTGLVQHAKKALNEKWQYVYGTIGQVLTASIISQKQQQYPNEINKHLSLIRTFIGKRTVDCVNLIKSYLWWNENKNDVAYDPKYDTVNGVPMSADGAFQIATEKGSINTIPEIPGVCVRYQGHIGVYIGNGEVIEARGTKYGVVKTKLKERPWTHWLKYPGIEYVEQDAALTWEQIIEKYTVSPAEWKRAITTIVNAVKAGGNLGDIEILQHLPLLIERIYTRKIPKW